MRTKPEPVGGLVLELRHALGLSQKAFALKAGLEREHLSMIETGRNKATSAYVRRALAVAADLDTDTLGRYLERWIDLDEALTMRKPEAA